MFELVTLDNGVRVIMEELPFVRSVSFGIWVKNGSRYENDQNNGISHFIEHMLFKGTRRRSAKDIADEMDAIGGQLNAYTAKEYTCYYARTLDTHFETGLDILADMFFDSVFDEDEIQKECNVIGEEISMYEDNPEDLVHDMLQYNIWQGNPLGFSVLGCPETIGQFKGDTFRDFIRERYFPENTVLAVAGSFDKAKVRGLLERYFGGFTRRAAQDEAGVCPAVYTKGVAFKEKEIEQVHLCMGYPSIPIGSENAYTLAVLNAILGGGMSSRLFQSIREERGLVYSVYSYNVSYADTGLFSIYAGLNPAQAEQVVGLVRDEIRLLLKEGISKEQLYRTKDQIKSSYILNLESSSNRMNSIGRSVLMLGYVLSPDEILRRVDEVTLERFQALTEAILAEDKLSMAFVGNLDGVEADRF